MREALIDLGAIRHNVGALREAMPGTLMMVVVKAAAYGHGAVPVARAAVEAGADWLGVVDVAEALELRAAGIAAPTLAWLHGPEGDYAAAIAADVDLGVYSLEQLRAVAAVGGAQVQLKIDTGLGRGGATTADWRELVAAAAAFERDGKLAVRGVWSHLANTDEASDSAQIAEFQSAIDVAREAGIDPSLTHLAASAGALTRPDARFDMVRLGIAVYGLSPDASIDVAPLGLRPAMELAADVVTVKRVPAGTGVSYGHHYRTTRETSLALVPLGYGDGVPRHASGRGRVSINGRTYTVCGRVAMDQIVLDVGDDPVRVGDRAVLFGDPATGAPSAEDWALAADTIGYEIVTRIGARVPRRYQP